MHSQSNNSQHVHVDYKPITRKACTYFFINVQKVEVTGGHHLPIYIDGFLISTISLFCRKLSKFLLHLGVDIFNTNEKNTQTNLLSFIQNEK